MDSISDKNKKLTGMSATDIKLIAAVSMFIDHIGAFVVLRLIKGGIFKTNVVLFSVGTEMVTVEAVIYYLLRAIGSISFPIFCFFLVEGFRRTHSRTKYALRLLLFAVISEAPFTMAYNGTGEKWWTYLIPSNVLYTLLLGLIIIWGAETLKKYAPGGFVAICFRILVCIIPTAYIAYEINSILAIFDEFTLNPIVFIYMWGGLALATLWGLFIYGVKTSKENARVVSSSLSLLSLGMLLADFLEIDYRGWGLIVIFIMYLVCNKNRRAGVTYSVVALILSNFAELPTIADIFLLSKYNGERGKGYKYFFYIFYPAHIAIIALVLFLTGLI